MTRLRSELSAAEAECASLREQHSEGVKAAAECKSKRDGIQNRLQTIGDLAVRRAYSTESVQQFFNYVRGRDWEPLGILADFIEVDTRYESIVEDFLRPELQYVVVKDRAQASAALCDRQGRHQRPAGMPCPEWRNTNAGSRSRLTARRRCSTSCALTNA